MFSELTLKDEKETRTFNFRGTVILIIHIEVEYWSVNLLPNLGSLKLCHTLIKYDSSVTFITIPLILRIFFAL